MNVRPVTRGLGTLRVLIAINALAVLTQAVSAGMFLGGDAALKNVHGIGAFVVHAAGLLLLIVAVPYWRPWRGSGFPALAGLVLLLAGLVQSMTGGSGTTSVHVPLGVAMFGLTVWLGVWSLRR